RGRGGGWGPAAPPPSDAGCGGSASLSRRTRARWWSTTERSRRWRVAGPRSCPWGWWRWRGSSGRATWWRSATGRAACEAGGSPTTTQARAVRSPGGTARTSRTDSGGGAMTRWFHATTWSLGHEHEAQDSGWEQASATERARATRTTGARWCLTPPLPGPERDTGTRTPEAEQRFTDPPGERSFEQRLR